MFSMGETIGPMGVNAGDPAFVEIASIEDELAAFFGAHYDRMVGLASLICRRGGSAEDAVQAAMEQAWKARASLRDADRLRWWLDRIVVREAIRMNRRPWWDRHATRFADGQAQLLPDPVRETTPERLALVQAFEALSPEQRAAAVLHLHLGYSVEETADLMRTGIETTRSRLRLARRRLRAVLSEGES